MKEFEIKSKSLEVIMKKFETKIKDSNMTLKVTYGIEQVTYQKDGKTYKEDADILSFYTDELLMEKFYIQSIINLYKVDRLVASQVFPAGSKLAKVYNAIIEFMYDEHEEIYDTIKMNDEFIEFLENIVKEN